VPAWKRGLDVLGAAVGLLALAPLLAAIAALIAVVSPGPVFFGQRRVGRGGAEFTMWKFRTMRVGTDTQAHERAVSQEIAVDGRLTKANYASAYIPFGPLLRKSSLDELPQLFNVLLGTMSLVGPRPEPVYAVKHYHPWHRRRLDVLPGMTGLWQISGKNRTTFRRMLELDLAYAERQSLGLDLWILLKTPLVILEDLLGVPASTGRVPQPR
jgi:lipopolysaccharide/colanic/teichoic acid biosynthesis glycosyltransferase